MRNKSKSRADHSNEDWRNLIKKDESFRKFKLFKTRFEFSQLKNCDFSAVSAKRACFIRADLSGSDFTGANLEHANFSGANFEGAILDGATFVHSAYKKAKKLKLSEHQLLEIEKAELEAKETGLANRLALKAIDDKTVNNNPIAHKQ